MQGFRRTGGCTCRAPTDLFVELLVELGATVEEAEKAESGLRFWTWSDTSNMSEANARNLTALLQWRLELNDAELKELVLRLPALLFYDVEKDLLPRLEALQNSRLKLSDAELKQVVMLQPLVLSWSVEKTILPSPKPDLSPGVGIAWLLRQTLASSSSAVSKPNFASKQ